MIEFIIIGLVAIVLLYIVILYCVNSKKIKQKQNKTDSEKKADKNVQKSTDTKPKVVEVKSQVIKGTMFEEAVKEAEKSGFNYDAMCEPETASKPKDNSRLKLDREQFVSEIKMADKQRLQAQKLMPERPEGPSITSNKKQTSNKQNKESFGEQINNLSPELKALLMNDVLNKKY